MEETELKSMVINFIAENFDLEAEDIDDDTALFSSNILDSFSMLELVTFLEEQLNTKFEMLDLHLGNLDSIEKIIAFLQRKAV